MSLKEISLYIHIPFCVSKCSYCDFFSIPVGCKNNSVPDEYITALCNEIKTRLEEYRSCIIKTVYIGGGTPSLLNNEQIKKISDVIKAAGVTNNYEFTFEVNPDDVSKDLLLNLEEAGVNRISCGIQSFSEDVLKSVHRRANSIQNYDCFKLFKDFWHKKLSVDLICGLPYETESSMLNSLEYLVEQKIAHISFYSLCVEDETPLGQAIVNGDQKYDFDFSDSLWIKGRDFLLAKGYLQYEVSNFSLPGFECLHNMTYWNHKDYIGCGAGGTGTLHNHKSDFRYTNTKDIKEYVNYWTQASVNSKAAPQTIENIPLKTSQFEYFMMALRTSRGVSLQEYEEIFNEKMPLELVEKLSERCKKSDSGFYYLEKEQLLFLNNFLEEIYDLINRE